MKKISKVICLVLTLILLVSTFGCGEGNQTLELLNAVAFESQTIVYDGQEHSLSVDDLPDGVTVTYDGNGQTNAGVYTVKATLSKNGQSVEKMATLTVNKATLTVKAKDALLYVGQDGFEYEIEGFVNGETADVLSITPTFVNEKNQAGIYVDYINFSGGSAENYDFVYETADLKLLPLYSDYEENGVTYIEFGSYPQTVVSDVTLLAGLLQSYDQAKLDENGYFIYNGERYCKAIANVMEDVDDLIDNKMLFSDGTPIVNNAEYFFKVEPIKWRVVDSNDGEYVLMSEMLIDTMQYNDSALAVKGEDDKEIYASNWEYSDIRSWLNGEFVNKAFADVQNPFLFENLTDNSTATVLYDRYANGKNTMDKVYLPSYSEIKDMDKSVLLAVTTDYARAMGAYMLYGDYGYWWTRSPGATGSPSYIYPSTGTLPAEHANVSVVAPNATAQVVLDKYNQVKNEWTCLRPFINFIFAD